MMSGVAALLRMGAADSIAGFSALQPLPRDGDCAALVSAVFGSRIVAADRAAIAVETIAAMRHQEVVHHAAGRSTCRRQLL